MAEDSRAYTLTEFDIMREFSEQLLNKKSPFTDRRTDRLQREESGKGSLSPSGFETLMLRNTKAQEELLNRLQFYEEPDETALDPATYIAAQDNEFKSLVPIGFEDQKDLYNNPVYGNGGGAELSGVYVKPDDTIAFPGQELTDATIEHEGRHPVYKGFNDISEELNNRNTDILTATARGDFETVENALNWKANNINGDTSNISENAFMGLLTQQNQAIVDNPEALQGYTPQLLEPEFMRGQNEIDFNSLDYQSLTPHDKISAINNSHKFRIKNGKYVRKDPIKPPSLFAKFKNLF